jgi:hypothetical protein
VGNKLFYRKGSKYIEKLLMINILVPSVKLKGIIAIIAIIDYWKNISLAVVPLNTEVL